MASTKHQKASGLRSNDYLPKAGPKSKGGGRHQHSSRTVSLNEPDLFERAKQDKIKADNEAKAELREQRELARQQTEARNHQFRVEQAELAKSLLNMGEGLTRRIAELVIDNFVVVAHDKSRGLSRTAAAELLLIEQLSADELKKRSSVDNGKYVARRVLGMAFDQLKASANTPAHEVKTLEAVTA